MAEEEHLPLFEELSNNNCPVVYSPGGGSQNTIRMAQVRLWGVGLVMGSSKVDTADPK